MYVRKRLLLINFNLCANCTTKRYNCTIDLASFHHLDETKKNTIRNTRQCLHGMMRGKAAENGRILGLEKCEVLMVLVKILIARKINE